jgi:hypothetical protein
MKYVMFRAKIGAVHRLVPVIFPEFMVHKDVAHHMLRNIDLRRGGAEVVSAGKIELNGVTCYDRSETLGVESRPRDGQVIEMYGVLFGIEP